MKRINALAVACLAVWTVSEPVLAHHSAAAFDVDKVVELTATVKQFNWTNPHASLVVETVDASGKLTEAIFEANGPGYLVRQGWKRESLHAGEKITIKANPMRDGGPGGNLVTVTMPDGTQLSALVKPPANAAGTDKASGGGYEK